MNIDNYNTNYTKIITDSIVDLESLNKINIKLKCSLPTFEGIRIVVDKKLIDNNYYIAISQELYDKLKEKNGQL